MTDPAQLRPLEWSSEHISALPTTLPKIPTAAPIRAPFFNESPFFSISLTSSAVNVLGPAEVVIVISDWLSVMSRPFASCPVAVVTYTVGDPSPRICPKFPCALDGTATAQHAIAPITGKTNLMTPPKGNAQTGNE